MGRHVLGLSTSAVCIVSEEVRSEFNVTNLEMKDRKEAILKVQRVIYILVLKEVIAERLYGVIVDY
jgi:hypothetical protein